MSDTPQNMLIAMLTARVGYGAAQAASVVARCTDQALLERVAAGDMEAINQLVAMAEQRREATPAPEIDST